MALEQYLIQELLVSESFDNQSPVHISPLLGDEPLSIPRCDLRRVHYELGYWHKAHHIHTWFVNNVQGGQDDCCSYALTRQQLYDLLILCEATLEHDRSDLLPTQIFVRSLYIKHTQHTIKVLKQAIERHEYGTIKYLSSW